MSHATIPTNIYLNKELQNDNVFVNAEIKSLEDITGLPTSSKFSKAIISENKIVSVVSNNYGFLKNEDYFLEIERKLIESDINYSTRSINRSNSHFAVDYILSDENYHIDIKNGEDQLTPMLRFTNSYAGGPTTGAFGFFRQVCSNGLHVAQTKVGFLVCHRAGINKITLPKIDELIVKFMSNEFFDLKKKFEVLAETKIDNLEEFVRYTCTKMDLFKYEKSEKNPEPSANAEFVMNLVNVEANKVNATDINLWLGYNAFNQIIHDKMKKPFTEQKKLDAQLFETVLELAN